jgi:formamidopyrimidine-DNA glycosylase
LIRATVQQYFRQPTGPEAMPELPEVETVCRGLAPFLEGHKLVRVDQRRKDLRFPFPEKFAARLRNRRVDHMHRRAKYILAHLDNGTVLIIHLGMSGRMTITPPGQNAPAPGKHDHVVFGTDDGAVIMFNDVRRFGLMTLAQENELADHPLLRDIGPEPLGNEFSGATLSEALKSRKTPIKSALLDQKIVAGIGNIYACEALYRAGISPKRLAASVAGARAERLVPAVRDVLSEAIAKGGSTLKDYVQTDGELGYFQHEFAVYGREGEPCPGCNCGGAVQRIVQAGRSTFFCAKRQR